MNKPLINSILLGLFYFFFCWSLEFFESTKGLFMRLMLFLPGLTFPLSTSYFKTKEIKYSETTRILHLILSIGIYHGSVWLYSGEGQIKNITIFAGFLGSFLFMLLSKFILKKEITLQKIFFVSLISGLAFLPYELFGRIEILTGLAIFIWTVSNGMILNEEHKKDING